MTEATEALEHHGVHEYSLWPLITGSSVLFSALALLAFFEWQAPVVGMIIGGLALASLAVGLAGWAREFFTRGSDEALGQVAVIVFIVSEVAIFGTMFAAFWMGRLASGDQWAGFVPAGLDPLFAVWLTFILWASSGSIVLAERAFAQSRRGPALTWLVVTAALGTLFVALHMNEWGHLIDEGFTVGANIYATTFYALTGVHTSHVIVGLISHLVLFGVVAGGLMGSERITLFKSTSLYWHFVDLMWLGVALNVYLVGSTA